LFFHRQSNHLDSAGDIKRQIDIPEIWQMTPMSCKLDLSVIDFMDTDLDCFEMRQMLSFRHDVMDVQALMPGLLMAIRRVVRLKVWNPLFCSLVQLSWHSTFRNQLCWHCVFCIHILSVVCWLMLKEMKQLIMDWPRKAHSKDTKVTVVLRSIARLINLSSNQIVVWCSDPSSCDVVCAVSCLWVGEDYLVQSSNLSMADFFCFAWGRQIHVCRYLKKAVKVKFLLCTYQLPLKLLPVICNSSSAVASRV
jgi:hypothetical protein